MRARMSVAVAAGLLLAVDITWGTLALVALAFVEAVRTMPEETP